MPPRRLRGTDRRNTGPAVANAESRAGLSRFAEQQAALRRVATLVAQGVPQDELFAAVAKEVGQLLPVEYTQMGRYESDGTFTLIAAWSSADSLVGGIAGMLNLYGVGRDPAVAAVLLYEAIGLPP
jgi:uncharacterized protein YoaH (UPF0181 family)